MLQVQNWIPFTKISTECIKADGLILLAKLLKFIKKTLFSMAVHPVCKLRFLKMIGLVSIRMAFTCNKNVHAVSEEARYTVLLKFATTLT